jgi:hypothetical protein
MPKVTQVLKHVSVQTAGAKRSCARARTKHSIAKGELFLLVRDGQGGYRNFCPECAEAVLDKAQEDLDALRADLNV